MNISNYLTSSIGRKQIVALTGLMLVGFLVGHLAGNLFFYGGPDAFNAYAAKLAHLRPGLLVVEFGLLVIFLIHIFFTAQLVMENRRARLSGYAVDAYKMKRPLSVRIMPYTGTILLAFVIYHLIDFTFSDHHGARSVVTTLVRDGNMSLVTVKSLGLYGVVWNSFLNPWHSAFYIVAMFCVGFHVSHGIQSVMQSFGFGTDSKLKCYSTKIGWVIALAFSSIPVYVLLSSCATVCPLK